MNYHQISDSAKLDISCGWLDFCVKHVTGGTDILYLYIIIIIILLLYYFNFMFYQYKSVRKRRNVQDYTIWQVHL